MKIILKLKSFITAQLVIVTIIITLGLFSYIIVHISGDYSVVKYLRIFDVGHEQSIPTYFSTLNLLLSSILLYVIYSNEKKIHHKGSNYWLFLSVLFLFLSLDESISIHENLGKIHDYLAQKDVMPKLLDTHQWLVFGSLFVVIIGLILLPFFKLLQKSTLYLFLLSGAIFLIGAIGFEFLGAIMLKTGFVESKKDFIYLIRRIFEEGFEMYGIAIFNCALYREISNNNITLTISSS